MKYLQPLTKQDISGLIPHADAMRLIDFVSRWDQTNIICQSDSHQDLNNPLRNNNQLSTSTLIEYGAQAMAIHGGLIARQNGLNLVQGYIAVLRDITFFKNTDISKIKNTLEIKSEKIMSSGGNMVYSFSVKSKEIELISGRATVIAKVVQ